MRSIFIDTRRNVLKSPLEGRVVLRAAFVAERLRICGMSQPRFRSPTMPSDAGARVVQSRDTRRHACKAASIASTVPALCPVRA